MQTALSNFLNLLRVEDKKLFNKQAAINKLENKCVSTVRVGINTILRNLLYKHASLTKANVSTTLIWIADDVSESEWLALLSSEVIPYFNDNNLFNYLGE